MDMDDILHAGETRRECRKANTKLLLEKLKAQSSEETHERLDAFLTEIASIVEFAQERIDEVSEEYAEIAALGDFGAVISATLTNKPLAYGACGSSKGINNAMKFAMLRTIAHEFEPFNDKNDSDSDSDSDSSEEE